ncbi:MAG TPA: hypothetical protein VHY48_07925 [Acidobacteriaceae bacterium]|jgi:ABC-2 type transport system permease protein|nr:hypothetical protein [Acidobacteriaceae bacterium]
MAELIANPKKNIWTAQQTVAQFRAIAWLRWRILFNGFRRKGGAGELVGRILVYPMLAAAAFFPTLGAGFAGWYFTTQGQIAHVSWLLWGAFILCQLLNINLGRPGTTFNPNELIRFPVRLRNFVAIRLFFGLLAPANVLIMLISLAIAVGISIARPSLCAYALIALAAFAAVNVLFTRMVFAWVDRWLSTRRAREIFTLLIFAGSIAFQWANVNFNPAYNHHRHANAITPQRMSAAVQLYHRAHPFLIYLPPELTGSALVAAQRGRWMLFTACVVATLLFAAIFLAVFTLRMRTEFRGEVLSDVANAVAARKPLAAHVALAPSAGVDSGAPRRLHSAVGVVLGKEFLYVRRNTGIFYSLIVPVVMVFLFAGKMSIRSNSAWLIPAAVAYTLFSVMPLSYNSFGLEAAGAQFYFLAPVRLRDVFLAKNILNLLLAFVEIVVVLAVIVYLSGRPSLLLLSVTLLWAASTLLIGLTLGNLRSVSSPKKIEFARAAGKQASPLSAFISMGVLLVLAAFGGGLLVAARFLNLSWVLLPAFAILLAVAFVIYVLGLKHVERYALGHREELFEELSKR